MNKGVPRIGWAAHEILWLEAALTLPKDEQPAAFRDIAFLAARSLKAVTKRAERLQQERAEAMIRATLENKRARIVIVPRPQFGASNDTGPEAA